jgi:hypothetical protein
MPDNRSSGSHEAGIPRQRSFLEPADVQEIGERLKGLDVPDGSPAYEIVKRLNGHLHHCANFIGEVGSPMPPTAPHLHHPIAKSVAPTTWMKWTVSANGLATPNEKYCEVEFWGVHNTQTFAQRWLRGQIGVGGRLTIKERSVFLFVLAVHAAADADWSLSISATGSDAPAPPVLYPYSLVQFDRRVREFPSAGRELAIWYLDNRVKPSVKGIRG